MTGTKILALAAALATATGGAALAQPAMQAEGWPQHRGGEARAGMPAGMPDVERMRERLERAGFDRTRVIGQGVIDAIGPDGQRVIFHVGERAGAQMAQRPGQTQIGPGPGMGMGRGPGMGPGMGPGRGMGPGMGMMDRGPMAQREMDPDMARQQHLQRRTEDLLGDALEIAGYTRFQRVAPAHLQAQAPDGRTVTIIFDGGMFPPGRAEAMMRQMQPGQMQPMLPAQAFDPRALAQAPRLETPPQAQAAWRDQPAPASILGETEVRNIIEAHGLTDVGEIERLGGNYHASAEHMGETVEVIVDGRTGVVLRPELDPDHPVIENDEPENGEDEAAG